MHSFLHNTVSVAACQPAKTRVLQSEMLLSHLYQTERISAGVQANLFHFCAFFLKLVLPQKKYIVYKYIKNKVMAIHWFYWCVSQKEMKRFVLITVSPQFPDDDAEINPGIKGSTSRTGPSCGFSEIQGLYIPGLRQESNTKATLYAAWWRRSTKLIFTKSSRSY